MNDVIIHRCPRKCPYYKNCFVCKTKGVVMEDVVIIHKCKVTKEEIPVHIGFCSDTACVIK